MRITNTMMINNSLANIAVNKNQLSTLDTQMSTKKKINRPSEDPIIAIRALRLRSSLNEVTQYLEKNIPDANSWMKVIQGALEEGENVVSDLYRALLIHIPQSRGQLLRMTSRISKRHIMTRVM